MHDLKAYFSKIKGKGVLATADQYGKVNAAVFAAPHCMDDGSVAFIMPDKLTHANLSSNGYATYLFMENGTGYKGLRLYLAKIREETNSDQLFTLRRKQYPNDNEKDLFLVFFQVEEALPLVGPEK